MGSRIMELNDGIDVAGIHAGSKTNWKESTIFCCPCLKLLSIYNVFLYTSSNTITLLIGSNTVTRCIFFHEIYLFMYLGWSTICAIF